MDNIFFITELFYPNKTSTAYILTEIAKHFTKTKNVSVICSSAAYDNNVTQTIDSDIDKINMILCDTPKVDKNSTISRVIGAIRVSMAIANKVLKYVKKSDTVFAVTNPFLLVLFLGVIRKFKAFRYILLVHDVFPENGVPAGVFKNNSLAYKIIKLIYDWAYSQADKHIVLGRDMEKLIISKSKKKLEVHVVENWFDDDLVRYVDFDRGAYLNRNVDGKIVLGFAGNLGRVQRIFDFVKLFSKIENENLMLLLVGDGAEGDDIQNFIMEKKLDNVIYLGPKARKEQSLFLNCFDIGLISLAPDMFGLGVPSKTYNILYLGKPILYLGDPNSEIDLLIREFSVGKSFSWREENNIVSYLNSLVKIDLNASNNGNSLAKLRFSKDKIMSKLEQVI